MEEQNINREVSEQSSAPGAADTKDLEKKLDSAGWGLFFIWVGVAFLANFEIGIGLLGVGIITLLMQVIRIGLHLKAEGFWVVIGLLFLLGGIWELFDPDLPLLAALLLIVGLLLIISSFRKSRK